VSSGLPDNLGEDLSAYIDGELSPERTQEIERLLVERPEVRAEVEALRAVSQQLGRLPRKLAPQEVGAVVRRAAEGPGRRASADAGGRTLRLFVRISVNRGGAHRVAGCAAGGANANRGSRGCAVQTRSAGGEQPAACATFGEARG
jgi:anti-sigma factor RsiW